ncbi:hypothetical protein PHMEG_00040181 [Phytophthora megakarya]|uniref:CCHC-type domain-containing protein n=1 Tax=Phytophthora megakarya TaxID=4795 RepID=A0A225UE63_9STRA|nr:hypothetical protein PHMEG_00040181 [Phytophthora megakarya]
MAGSEQLDEVQQTAGGSRNDDSPRQLETPAEATQVTDNAARALPAEQLDAVAAMLPQLISTMSELQVTPEQPRMGHTTNDEISRTGVHEGSGKRAVALFTNPQDVYNAYSGTWDPPPGHARNGKYWYEPRKTARKPVAASIASNQMESKRMAVNAKPRREQTVSSGEEPDEKPRKKRLKAAVKKTVGPEERDQETSVGQRRVSTDGSKCFTCGQEGHWSTQCPNGPKCFACNQYGHLARSCTDVDAKARNEEYLQKREQTRGSTENSKRTS